MAAIRGDEKRALEMVRGIPGVHVANLNSPRQIVVSGARSGIERALAAAREQGMEGVVLPIECAYHSPLLANAVGPLRAKLEEVEVEAPSSLVYRSAANRPYEKAGAKEIRDALANLYTSRVDFVSMLRDAYSRGARVFIEVGPKRALVDLAAEVLGRDKVELVPLLHPKGGERLHLLRASAKLWTLGLTEVPPARTAKPAAEAPAPSPSPSAAECLAVKREARPVSPPRGERDWRGRKVLLVSDGSGLAGALTEKLEAQGAEVESVTVPEAVSNEHQDRQGDAVRINELRERLETLAYPETVYFLPGFDLRTSSGPGDSYEVSLGAGGLAAIREVARTYAGRWEEGEPGELIVATRMDGRGGHTITARGRTTGGALVGFLRALHREMEDLRTQVLDLPPLVATERAAEALIEVVGYEGRHVERGRFSEDWTENVLVPAFESPEDLLGDGDPCWEEDGTALLTGGARGITAYVARAMMAVRPVRFLLLGTTAPSAPDDPLLSLTPEQLQEEKISRFRVARENQPKLTPVDFERTWMPLVRGVEITQNVEALRSAGAEVEYVQVDLTDARSARAFADRLKIEDRKIEVLVHGAGIEKSKRIQDADPDEWDRTFAVKVGGLHSLLHLVGPRTRGILLFGSIAASFGGHGQTDYCAANEYLNRFAFELAATLPQTHIASVAWPPWEEIGMAATRGGSRRFLEAHGIRFMSPTEGGRWALAALSSEKSEPEVILLPPNPPEQAHDAASGIVLRPPPRSLEPALVDAVLPAEREGSIVRWQFDPKAHPYLLEHRVNEKVRLPAAHLLEQMAEAVQAAYPEGRVARLEQIEILSPVVLTEDRRRDLFVEVVPDEAPSAYKARLWTHPVLPDGSLVPNRIDIATATVVVTDAAPGEARVELLPQGLREVSPPAMAEEIANHGIYYGPCFQGIRGFAENPGFAYAAKLAPEAPVTAPGTSFLNVPLLDIAMQSLSYVLAETGGGIPTGFDRIELHRPLTRSPAQTGWALGRSAAAEDLGVALTDEEGVLLAEVQGVRLNQPDNAVASSS